jgi:Ca2+-binding RTX toxin-like protein
VTRVCAVRKAIPLAPTTTNQKSRTQLEGIMGVWTPGPGATAGNDTFAGDASTDFVNGDAGNDTLNGGDSNDVLFGGVGSDTLNGDAGNDILDGGPGIDHVFGGAGDDILVAAATATGGYAFGETYSGGDGVDTIRMSGVNLASLDPNPNASWGVPF